MANLASVILEGSMFESSVDTSNYDFSNSVVEESSYSDAAVASLFTDIMEAEQAYMVSDVIGAATILHESAMGNEVDRVAVAESVIKSGIGKLKAAFQKFIAKIKEYYKRVINWFKAMFSNGEDFAKNYGQMIKTKAAKTKDFHYTGWNYKLDAGDKLVTEYTGKINDKMQDVIGGFDFVKDSKGKAEFKQHLRDKNVISKDFKDDSSSSASDVAEKFLKEATKASDISDLRTTLTDVYHNNDSKKSDIKDFEAVGVEAMLTFLKNSKKVIDKFEKQLKTYEEKANKVISRLNGFESEKDEEGGANLVSNASYVASLMTAYLNMYKVPCEVQISVYKAASSEFLGALKKFYNFKGNKGANFESTEVEDLEAFAMLESDLVLEKCGVKESDDESDEPEVDEPATESVVDSILNQAARFTF